MRYTVNLEIFMVDKFLANLPCSAFAKKIFLKLINNKKKFKFFLPKTGLYCLLYAFGTCIFDRISSK